MGGLNSVSPADLPKQPLFGLLFCAIVSVAATGFHKNIFLSSTSFTLPLK